MLLGPSFAVYCMALFWLFASYPIIFIAQKHLTSQEPPKLGENKLIKVVTDEYKDSILS